MLQINVRARVYIYIASIFGSYTMLELSPCHQNRTCHDHTMTIKWSIYFFFLVLGISAVETAFWTCANSTVTHTTYPNGI